MTFADRHVLGVDCGTLAAALVPAKRLSCGQEFDQDSGSKRAAVHIKDKAIRNPKSGCALAPNLLKPRT
jgi:hypothetical protein